MTREELFEEWLTQIETILEAYDVQCVELTNWEVDFLESITDQLKTAGEISFKQSSALRKIYNKIK